MDERSKGDVLDDPPYALPGADEAAELRAMKAKVSAMADAARERYLDYASHHPDIMNAAIIELNTHPEEECAIYVDDELAKLTDKKYVQDVETCQTALRAASSLCDRLDGKLTGWSKSNPITIAGEWGWNAEFGRACRLPPPVSRCFVALPTSMKPLRMIDEALQPSSFLVSGLLDRGGLSLVYGQSYAGKSFVGLDLSLRIASGTRWRDRTTAAGGVLYVASEGGAGLRRRIHAWRERHGHAEAPFAVMEGSYDLTADSDVARLLAHVRSWQATILRPVALVVIDTLARNLGGADENSGAAMGSVVATAGRIQRETGAHMMLIHHSGKDAGRGPRGHNSLAGAADVILRVAAGAAVVEKLRDGQAGEKFPFKITPVECDRFESAIIEHVEADAVTSDAAVGQPALLAEAIRVAAASGRPMKANKAGGVYERRAELSEPLRGMSRSSLRALIREATATGLIANIAGVLSIGTRH